MQSTENNNISAQTERQQVIDWLVAHNYPALPVAPQQDAKKYYKEIKANPAQGTGKYCPLTENLQPQPLFTGKNPSYLDQSGKPHLLNHRQYQTQLPSLLELKQWFANPNNGIGTLGGWNDTIWLDFDVKKFDSEEDCTAAVTQILEQESLSNIFLETTHSGGWRIGVRVQQKPNFTNFALTPGGAHLGEALGEGRFTVLAPTIGPSGNPYQSINRALPPRIASLSSIGIYSTKNQTPDSIDSTKSQAFRNTNSTQSQIPAHTPNFVSPPVAIPDSILLERLGSSSSQEILNGANPTGDRSQALAIAIQEWYGWTNWAINNGISITGDTTTLSLTAGSLLGIDSDRIERILKTIDPTTCHPAALHRGGEESCWKKIYRLNKATFEAKCPAHIKASIKREWGRGASNSVNPPNSSEINSSSNSNSQEPPKPEHSLRDCILKILAQEPTQSQQKEALIELAQKTGNSLRTIEQLAEAIASEIEFGIDTATASQNLKNLLSTRKTQLNLKRYLEPWFAEQLVETAKAMPTAPEFLFTTLLAAAASRIGTAAKVVIKSSGQYTQPMVIWSAIVADSGAMKTPAQRVILEPLIAQETEAAAAYELQLHEYQTETERRKFRKRDDAEESILLLKPIRKRYITKDITLETLQRIHGENPRGLLYYRDELVGMHKSRNLYRGGVGADEEAELDQHNGSAIIYDRGDKSVCIAHSAISRTGSIQWEILAAIMGDHGDFNGQFARWLFCAAKAPKRYLKLTAKDADVETSLSQVLKQLYRDLEKLAPRDYLLSFDAKHLFEIWQHQLVDAQGNEPEGTGISLVYPKIEGYTARLALWLHIVNATLRGEAPTQVISAQTMELAIELAAYFLWQHKLVHSRNSPDAGAMPLLMKIHSFASRIGQVTASALKSGIRALKKMTTAQIRELMKATAQSGMGQIKQEKNQLVYIPELTLKGVNFDKKLAEVSTAQTLMNTGLERRIDEIDTWVNLSEKNPDISISMPSRQFVNELPSTLVSQELDQVDNDHQLECQLTNNWQEKEVDEIDAIAALNFTDSVLSSFDKEFDEIDNPEPIDTHQDGAIYNEEAISYLDDNPEPIDTHLDEAIYNEEAISYLDDNPEPIDTHQDGAIYNEEAISYLDDNPDLDNTSPNGGGGRLLPSTLSNPADNTRSLEDDEMFRGDDVTSLVLDSQNQNPLLTTVSDEISLQTDVTDAAIPEPTQTHTTVIEELTQANSTVVEESTQANSTVIEEPTQTHSTVIEELVQLTIDGKAEPIECKLPQPTKKVVEPVIESVKEPLHNFQPGQQVISLATYKKGVVTRLHNLDLVVVRFEEHPEFECPCSYKRLRRLNRLN